jgi:hypothetical protein
MKAVREKIARLRALRIAKETEEKSAALGEDAAWKKSVKKGSAESTEKSAPPASLLDQPMGGLRD